MTTSSTPPSTSGVLLQQRWRQLVARVAPTTVCWRLAASFKGTSDASPAADIAIREIFVHGRTPERRRLDLMCAALLIPRQAPTSVPSSASSDRPEPVLRVFGPERLRRQVSLSRSGLSVADLQFGNASRTAEVISILLYAMERDTTSVTTAASIERLGDVLDFAQEAEGSTAVAHTIVRRLDVLAAGPGVTVLIGGDTPSSTSTNRLSDDYHLFVDRVNAQSMAGAVEINDGRVVTAGPDQKPVAWHGASFLLLGRPGAAGNATDVYSMLQRRSSLARAADRSGSSAPVEPFSRRVARARQKAAADRIVRMIDEGDVDQAAVQFADALDLPQPDPLLSEELVSRISSINAYWSVDESMRRGIRLAASSTSATGLAIRTEVTSALDKLLGVSVSWREAVEGNPDLLPIVTPIRLTIGDALVPFVDSRRDAGRFLYELIPDMRDRITDDTGVRVPGVRARGGNLADDEFTIELDEVQVDRGTVSLVGYTIAPWTAGADLQLAALHPLNSKPGAWGLAVADDGDSLDESVERMDPSNYLIHRIDLAVRAALANFVGPDGVATMLKELAGSELASTVVPNTIDKLQLTWLLQRLIADRVPIHDLSAILSAVREAGGWSATPKSLRRAVRAVLLDQPRFGDDATRVTAPMDLQVGVGIDPATDFVSPWEASEPIMKWIERQVAEHGQSLCLVTEDQELREVFAAIARAAHYPFIVVLARDELAGQP